MTRFSLAVTLMLMLLRPALALDVGEISAFMLATARA